MRFFLVTVLGALTVALCPIASLRAFAQQSPEEMNTHTEQGCRSDSECSIPSSMLEQQGMEARCLAPRCQPNGACGVEILKDKLLGDLTAEDPKQCFVYEYRCGADGKKIVVEQESSKRAAREGELCQGSDSEANPCVTFTCKNKECVRDVEKLHGQSCKEDQASPVANVCQNAQCDMGKCVPVPDPEIKDDTSTKCGDDVMLDDGCQVNTKRCNTSGRCVERTSLRSGAECGPPPNSFVAPAEQLPQSFKDLFLKDQTPQFSCDISTCKLEYCGDNKTNREEEQCDGTDIPKTAPPGSRCSADCKIVSPDCSAFRKNPNFLEVANINGTATVSYPSDGSFKGPIAEVKSNMESKGYTVEVAWEPGYTGGITGADSLSLHALALCAWKPERRPGCESLGSKPGLKVTALGIPDAESCDSPAAQNAYQKFKADYVGFESLFTGNNVGFSVSPNEPYIYPLIDGASAPETMSYCEVCFYPVCGNGVRTEGEECDGKDLGPNAQPGYVCSDTCTLGPCQERPDEPVSCSVDPVTGVGIEVRKTFSIEQCGYEETRTEKPKPQETCQETVIGLRAERSTPRAFVAKEGRCEWELQKETLTSPYTVRCSIDQTTGKGLQEGSVLDTATCQWKNTRLLRARPAPTCRETRAGVTALLRQYNTFVKAAEGGCRWVENATQVNSGVTPGCAEANNKATLTTVTLISNMQSSPPVCRYDSSTKVEAKPPGFCAERGTATSPKAELVSYVLNKNTCSYAERIDRSTARPSPSCQYRASSKTAEATTYAFNQAKCGYDPVKATKPQPPDSCGEEVRKNVSYAVSRIYGSSLDSKTCDFKPTERLVLTPTTYECSARNGQRYQRATLDRTPRVCSYTQVTSGSCCYYTLTVRSGLAGQTGLKGGAGCLSSVVSRATQQCQGRGDMTDDCIAGKVGGNWSAESGCTQGGGSVHCGSAEYVFFQSPVSLRWADDTANKELAFARFSLSDDSQKKVVVWRASSALPLLVYDPEHKGEITSARQLFGNVFQGGRNGKDPWSDGYEALGSLDADKDEKISGKELEPLGLWFDENRDGVSQPGEVKPLNHHDVNVTALFYKGGAYNTVTKDIDLAIGFERIVGGHIEQGASVDWYTEEASSQMELINSLSISSFFARYEKNGESESSSAPMTPVTNATVKQRTLYQWSTDDAFFMDGEEQKPQGMFSIVELSDGSIRGYLFGESFMRDGDRTISNTGAVKITGRIETLGDGRRSVTFDSVKDTKNGTDTHTTATLSADGKTIEGTTTQTLTYEGEDHTFSYSWTGRVNDSE